MAAFYANENFPRPAVEALRLLGHNVLTIAETGRAGVGLPDEEVLAFAASEQRILLTFNRKHFIRLHERGHQQPASLSAHSTQISRNWPPGFTRPLWRSQR